MSGFPSDGILHNNSITTGIRCWEERAVQTCSCHRVTHRCVFCEPWSSGHSHLALPQHVVHLPPPGNSGTFCSVHTKSSSTSVQRTSCLSFRKVFTSLLCGGACYLKEGCLFLSRLLLQYQPVWLGACLSDWNSGFSSVALNSPRTIWLHMRVYIHLKARPDVCVVAVEVALLSEYHSVTACSNHGTLGALITTHMSIELPRSHHFLPCYLLYRSVWYQ